MLGYENQYIIVYLQKQTTMALVNEHLLKLPEDDPWTNIDRRVNAYHSTHPDHMVIDLHRPKAALPLCPAVVEAMHEAINEIANDKFSAADNAIRGHVALREAILQSEYIPRGIHLDIDEIFVNSGVHDDLANMQELLRWDNSIGIAAPANPLYTNANAMIGRSGKIIDGSWSNVLYFPCNVKNKFIPELPNSRVDMIYLAHPANPTGAVMPRDKLQSWVTYALKSDAIIFFDATYAPYISDDALPHSIFELRGARRCAVEFRSFDTIGGLTGLHCGYTVVPKELNATTLDEERRIGLNQLWELRQRTKQVGASHITQKGATAVYTHEGQQQVNEAKAYYMHNAKFLREALVDMSFKVYGGLHAPYIWVQTLDETDSRHFADSLLYGCGVVCTPGIGYGPGGEKYCRFTTFTDRRNIEEALQRIESWQR